MIPGNGERIRDQPKRITRKMDWKWTQIMETETEHTL